MKLTRPYKSTPGPVLISLIHAGNAQALVEAQTYRTVPSVRKAAQSYAATIKATPRRTKKSAPAPVKVERTDAEREATALRKLAWQMRLDAHAAGKKLTYAEACAVVGVAPARKS